MTLRKFFPFALAALFFFACDPETEQVIRPTLIPLKMEALDGTRELVYDDAGKLTGLWMISRFPNGTEMRSLQSLFYNDAGQLTTSTTDTGWRIEYTMEGDHIVKTDEYVNGTWSQVHRYFYNDRGQLTESKTFQDIPEEGGLIPVASVKYVYDKNDNLKSQSLFFFTSFGAEEKLLTTITFGNYDKQFNSEDLFSFSPFNPLVKFRNNNPEEMTVGNGKGVVSSVNRYTYTYNEEGYAVGKTTVVSMPNHDDQQFETSYFFKK